jgi:hypothetical protein
VQFFTGMKDSAAINQDQLAFPKKIASVIGYCAWSIGAMKKAGCRFVGRKTTIRWVRQFLTAHPEFKTSTVYPRRKKAGSEPPRSGPDHPYSTFGKSDEPQASNDR